MDLIDIYKKGIDNDIKVKGKINKKTNIAIFLFLILITFFNKQRENTIDSLIFSNGLFEYKLLKPFEKESVLLFHGKGMRKITDIINTTTIVSNFSFKQRKKILIEAMTIFFKKKKDIKYLSFWLEFNFIFKLLNDNKVKDILVCGHYDRYTTWLSNIANFKNSEFEILQHGVVGIPNLPHKIFCSKVHGFNESEINKFKKYIIANDTCQYVNKGFQSHVTFKEYNDENKYIIGIASQYNYAETKQVIDEVLKIDKDILIAVMLHPRESSKEYRKYKSESNVRIEATRKISNIDILIVFTSTLLYDYLYNDYNGRIICIQKDDFSFDITNDKIIYASSINQLNEIVRELI